MKRVFPPSFYNMTTLSGSAIAVLSLMIIFFLMLLETFAGHQKPYMGIIAFVIMPAFLILGLLLIAVGIVREHRREVREGDREPHLPRINLNDPRHRKAFIVFSVSSVLLLAFTAFGSFKAYEYTDSDQFCGQMCHKVMGPEFTAYSFSPHAQVGCVQCHIGPGADWFVRSKISGSYQMYATLMNKYPRPIPTPIENLRPAQDTCEQCHWPRHFYSEKLQQNTYYVSDKNNTKWSLRLLIKIGGGNIEVGPTSGIHWHMNIANEITYGAKDPKRMVIPWVKVKRSDGTERVYRSSDVKVSEEEITKGPKRRMDCIDCHNRPTHIYHPAARSVNHLMSLGWIDPELPFIKKVSIEALEAPYESTDAGLSGIKRAVEEFYRKEYPDLAVRKKEQIQRAVSELQTIYSRNYFPYMKVDWKRFPNHIGHLYSPGCFRCHDGKHVSDDGKVLSTDCNVCHTIMAQQFPGEEAQFSRTGLDYRHPVDIGKAWMDRKCSDCHGGAPLTAKKDIH
ncbi:MAG TPA: NapC/NirT family cytochrome c [Dissulfurispiraceae bacterium]|nr:NapC/NirT family cytochrome c [Dissulfurispiraceae bacterium]